MSRILPPEDLNKYAVNLSAVLGGLGALATMAYSAAYLKDRSDRIAWQKRIEKQLADETGKKGKAYVPEAALGPPAPIVVVDPDTKKVGSLLTKLAEARRALTLPRQ